MEQVTIFGGSGFLGSYVADELSLRGYKVILADIQSSPYLGKNQKYLECDIMDSERVREVLKGSEIVFNFAGMADLDDCINRPRKTIEQNVLGNLCIIENLIETPIKRFVYASSVYAASREGAFYGISKSTSEKLIHEFGVRYNLPYTIVRYGSLYGERSGSQNGIYRTIEEALSEKKITYSGDGDETREYIHAIDAAKLSVDVIENNSFRDEIITLTGVEKLNRRDLVKMIEEIIGKKIHVEYSQEKWEGHYKMTPYAFQPKRAKKLVPNPFIDLGQGIALCVEAIYQNSETE